MTKPIRYRHLTTCLIHLSVIELEGTLYTLLEWSFGRHFYHRHLAPDTYLHIEILCLELDLQLSSMERFCVSSLRFLTFLSKG